MTDTLSDYRGELMSAMAGYHTSGTVAALRTVIDTLDKLVECRIRALLAEKPAAETWPRCAHGMLRGVERCDKCPLASPAAVVQTAAEGEVEADVWVVLDDDVEWLSYPSEAEAKKLVRPISKDRVVHMVDARKLAALQAEVELMGSGIAEERERALKAERELAEAKARIAELEARELQSARIRGQIEKTLRDADEEIERLHAKHRAPPPRAEAGPECKQCLGERSVCVACGRNQHACGHGCDVRPCPACAHAAPAATADAEASTRWGIMRKRLGGGWEWLTVQTRWEGTRAEAEQKVRDGFSDSDKAGYAIRAQPPPPSEAKKETT